MKFPLAEHPFHAVDLTEEQSQEYENVTNAILEETLEEYHRFVHLDNRTLHKKRWKPVKTRENLTVYKELDRSVMRVPTRVPSGSVTAPSPHSTSGHSSASSSTSSTITSNMHEWKLPKLLGVGTIVGTLEDVMYGVAAPDVKTMLLRSSYVQDELVDGGVLYQMKGAVEDDPFRFLGIKWLVKAHPTGINAIVAPRDTVVIDGVGIRIDANGERIGYHVFHSVELPECPELKDLGILRGYLSSCYLFKQLRNGTVEVYMKSYCEPGGNLPEAVATLSVANALIGCWKSVRCSHGKKLAWMIKNAAAERIKRSKETGQNLNAKDTSTSTGKKYECELCHGSFRAYKSANGCQICLKVICTRCQSAQKVSHMQRGLQVKQSSIVVCKDCITRCSQLNAQDVARTEFVGRPQQQQSRITDESSDEWLQSSRSVVSSDESGSDPSFSDGYSTSYDTSVMSGYGSSVRTASLDTDDALELYDPPRLASSLEPIPAENSTVACLPRTGSWQSGSRLPPPSSSPYEGNHRQQLWLQMNQLRLAAEQTYMIAKQNTNAMRTSPSVGSLAD
ncbi:hypothetical protein ATCC90586_003993 [Pythium insidiosum]|nr:hypothetical protein ATCC90586_003993 [Pythium insidiosum]